MPSARSARRKMVGAAPGTLVYTGEKKTEQPRIRVMRYGLDTFAETDPVNLQAIPPPEPGTILWVHIGGLHDLDLMESIGKRFALHPLTLEDIVNIGHRPKLEEFDDYLYVCTKHLSGDGSESGLRAEQISIVFGEGWVLSFQEGDGDVFGPVRDRIRAGRGRIRKTGADYLTYALLDTIVDGYLHALEAVDLRIITLEEMVVEDASPDTIHGIHQLKREMILFRKLVVPMREVTSSLIRNEYDQIRESTTVFLRDVYDHTVQVLDTSESFRDILSGLLDLYLSTASNRMNEVMKMLTIIATIFIPITFIAGVYGMNFKYMPELEWRGSYFVIWGIMLIVALAMVRYFRRKRWL